MAEVNPFAGCEWGCTDDHRCSFHRVVDLDLSCDWCGQEEPHEGRCPRSPARSHITLPLDGLEETIARALVAHLTWRGERLVPDIGETVARFADAGCTCGWRGNNGEELAHLAHHIARALGADGEGTT